MPNFTRAGAPVSWGGDPSTDAFGRKRVCAPVSQYDVNLQYDSSPLLWQTALVGAASVTFLPNQSSVQMSTTTANGDKVTRQTFKYFRAQPGKSQEILLTFVLGTTTPNVRKRVGYFDTRNGIFLEDDGTGLFLVRRTFTSGVAVDTRVAQSQWNVDRLDGTGPSQTKINVATVQILIIDLEGPGAGRVRAGFIIDGQTYYAHDVALENKASIAYMTTPNLPLRLEVENTGAAGAGTNMLQISGSVLTEGGPEPVRGYSWSVNNGIVGQFVTTRRPVISIRPKATFNSVVNRGQVAFTNLDAMAGTNSALWELVYNPVVNGAVFSSANASSIVEFDTAGTTITGGLVLDSGYLPATSTVRQVADHASNVQLPLTLDLNGANPQVLSLVCTSLSGAAAINASMAWCEVY